MPPPRWYSERGIYASDVWSDERGPWRQLMRVERVLDKGYVQSIEHWGSDERIVEAARMSTGKGFLGWGPKITRVRQCTACMIIEDEPGGQDPCSDVSHRCSDHHWGPPEIERRKPGDEKLLGYLYKNRHTSPFEMAGAVFEIKAPIVVFREWHRHRTQSYNEMSARYVPLPDEDYMPSHTRCLPLQTTNRQAQGSGREPTATEASSWLTDLEELQQHAQRVYQRGLDVGIPREIARGAVTVFRYSRMRAQAVLKNWLDFLTLRDDEAAQWEIRQYAHVVSSMLDDLFPRTMELYHERRAQWKRFLEWEASRER